MKEIKSFIYTRDYTDGFLEEDEFDSPEEYWFGLWCIEAIEHGVLNEFSYHMMDFKLTEKHVHIMNNGKKFILQPHKYTPDFSLDFNIFMPELLKPIVSHLFGKIVNPSDIGKKNISIVDVKGQFQRFGGDRAFSLNQKMTMEKYGIPIHKIVPEKFFKKTWVPKAIVAGKKIPRLKKWRDCKLLEEIWAEQS